VNGFETIVCFCPARRFFLASLVLSTWTGVRRWILTNDDSTELADVDAVMVMDEYVTDERVARLAARHPVLVLAWNGGFEIERYRQLLGDRAELTYVGTDETLPGCRYAPMIDGACPYATWRDEFQRKTRFTARGTGSYRSHWRRTQLSASRWWRLVVSSGGALLSRRSALRQTVRSGFISDRLVWAGNCQLDPASLDVVAREMDAARGVSAPDERLRAALAVIDVWRAASRPNDAVRAHEVVYVANTLLRWAVLDYLLRSARPATWFFGKDNLGLDLELELYVYNLVSNHRTAFLDVGGKTSETFLYPRSLHLLVRQCYVIAFASPESAAEREQLATRLEHLQRRLTGDRRVFFDELEHRRRDAYAGLPASCTIAEAQRRIWSDFC
jgi:hypothetical protein